MAIEIRTRPFRVTYATARLQTLDGGAPVSPWTVEKELGHGPRAMPEEVYGRPGDRAAFRSARREVGAETSER
jgi:hypothetical protein